jgi:hypothetical protein
VLEVCYVNERVSGVEIQCIGHFRLLFGLLSVDSCKPIQHGALNVISSVTQNQECVNDIAASDVLVHLLLTLYNLPDAQITTLDTLYALMHTTKIVKDALAKGEHVMSQTHVGVLSLSSMTVSIVLRTSENRVIPVAKINYEMLEYSHTCSEVICMRVHASVHGEGEETAVLCHTEYITN